MIGVPGREGNRDVQVIIGVDTHQDEHVAVAIDRQGVRLGERHAPATTHGYGELEWWSLSLGEVRAFGIEGTGSYGAGIARFLTGRGYTVVEVNPDRSTRYRKGKSDPTDAEMAARSVLAGVADATPKSDQHRSSPYGPAIHQDPRTGRQTPAPRARRPHEQKGTRPIRQRGLHTLEPVAFAGRHTRRLQHRSRPHPGPPTPNSDGHFSTPQRQIPARYRQLSAKDPRPQAETGTPSTFATRRLHLIVPDLNLRYTPTTTALHATPLPTTGGQLKQSAYGSPDVQPHASIPRLPSPHTVRGESDTCFIRLMSNPIAHRTPIVALGSRRLRPPLVQSRTHLATEPNR